MSETTPIFDEVAKFMNGITAHTPAIEKALGEFGKAAHQWHIYIEEWGRQWGRNSRMFGTEFQSAEDLERQARREKRRKERENCLHGRNPFQIHWGVSLKCPQCYSKQVYVGSERLWCLLCGWKQWRIGKKPRTRFTNG